MANSYLKETAKMLEVSREQKTKKDLERTRAYIDRVNQQQHREEELTIEREKYQTI